MRPKLLTNWWLRAAYILCCTGVGAGIASVAKLPFALMVGLCAAYAAAQDRAGRTQPELIAGRRERRVAGIGVAFSSLTSADRKTGRPKQWVKRAVSTIHGECRIPPLRHTKMLPHSAFRQRYLTEPNRFATSFLSVWQRTVLHACVGYTRDTRPPFTS